MVDSFNTRILLHGLIPAFLDIRTILETEKLGLPEAVEVTVISLRALGATQVAKISIKAGKNTDLFQYSYPWIGGGQFKLA